MPSDPFLLERLRNALQVRRVQWSEKNMFGGTAFMVDDKMCFGTFRNGVMVRVNPDDVETLLKRPATEQMMQANRTMVGYLMVEGAGYDMDEDLEFWVEQCLAWNPHAKASKRRKNTRT